MGYRRGRGRGGDGLGDVLAELIVAVVVGGFALVGRAIAQLWRGRGTVLRAEEGVARRGTADAAGAPSTTLPARAPARDGRWSVDGPAEPLPYRRAAHLLSKGEQAIWYPLYQAVKGKYRVFCKVRLADVVCCPRSRRDERKWFRKIGRYHVDFVLAEPETTEPLMVIELDDRRHRARRRKEIDAFKDRALQAAGVPVYRVLAQEAYAPDELALEIQRKLQGVA